MRNTLRTNHLRTSSHCGRYTQLSNYALDLCTAGRVVSDAVNRRPERVRRYRENNEDRYTAVRAFRWATENVPNR